MKINSLHKLGKVRK